MASRSNGDRRHRSVSLDQIIERREPPAVDADEDGGLDIGTTPAELIEESVVDAVCIDMKKVPYARFGQTRWLLTFAISYPEKYNGQNLEMFIHDYGKKIRMASKLCHAVAIASRGLRRNQKVKTTLFVGKMIRVKTRVAISKDGEPYTVADEIVEKLTG